MMDESSVSSSINEAEAAHIQFKNGQQSLKPDEIQETKQVQAEVQRDDPGSPDSSFGVIADFLDGKNVNETENEPCSSQQDANDADDVVEELTVKTCEGSSMAIVGSSSSRARLEINRTQFLPSSSSMDKREGDKVITSILRNAGKTSTGDVERNPVPVDALSHGGIKTKMLSQSGFSQFFVKKTLKGKGVTFRGPPLNRSKASNVDQQSVASPSVISNDTPAKVSGSTPLAVEACDVLPLKGGYPSSCTSNPSDSGCGGEGLSLRDWLKSERQEVNKAECFRIFRQIVEHVDDSHSQGVVLSDPRPSLFKVLKENEVKYVGSGFHRESSDSNLNKNTLSQPEKPLVRRRLGDTGFASSPGVPAKKHKSSGPSSRQWPMFQRAGGNLNIQTENDVSATQELRLRSSHPQCGPSARSFTSMSEQLEEKWYASPEELRGETRSVSSNIYSLGILLFELLSQFQSERAREAVMSDIRHRILPPKFLSENPKEAGFCLWDILQSEVVNGIPDLYAEGLSLAIEQEDTESELLQHFLVLSQEQMQKHAGKLMGEIVSLEADIEEIVKRRCAISPLSALAMAKRALLVENSSQQVSGVFPFGPDHFEELKLNLDHPKVNGETTVSNAATEVAAIMGENVKFRRGFLMSKSSAGVLSAYLHTSPQPGLGRIAGIVSLEVEGGNTQLEAVQRVGSELAMHVVAAKPLFLSKDLVSSEALANEREILKSQAESTAKSQMAVEKMVEGRLRKYFEDVALMEQKFIVNDSINIKTLVDNLSKEVGSPVKVADFLRVEVGEGIERLEASDEPVAQTA
ncbi:hypothetical protein F2Q68_00020921 [Brassica cretica]|uniref:Elongation factor Ts, mitochondrial n=1 Tax=Brassica cretica TaxID=69181 RepID=A0A8S9FU71_BRACR|nr:hypothetical protein F2Q68_00020921 [Brassica cretica]